MINPHASYHLLLILIALLFIYSHCTIPPNYTFTSTAILIPNIHDLGYSHDQRLLIVIQQGLQNMFYVYDGLRINNQNKIPLKDQRKPSASPSVFAFTHDDSLLLIGTQEGSVFGYKIINQTVSESWAYNISFGSKEEVFTVRSISVDVNGNIVVAVKENIYVLGIPEGVREDDNTAEFVLKADFGFKHLVQSVSWLQENVLIVGALGESNGNFSLFYTNNKTQKPINYDKTLTLSVSTDGKTIYKSTVDNNIEVWSYQSGDVPKFITTIPESNSSSKIVVSEDGKLVAVVVRGGRVKSWRVAEEGDTNLKMEISQQMEKLGISFGLNLNEEGKNLALSQIANDLILIPTTDTSQLPHFTLCLPTTYLSPQQSDCLPCSPNCATCFTQQTCISCTNDKFIDGDSCSKCNTKLNGCLTCESGEKCITCDEDEEWNQQAVDGKCQCKETYYEKEGKCEECGVFLDCYACDKEDHCTNCKDEGNFDTKPVDGKCQCKQSFWLNITECLQCSTAIKDCIDCTQDGKQCHKCQSPTRQPSPDQSKCQCIAHYYEDPTDNSCQLCDQYQTCLQCLPQNPSICTKCDTTKGRKQSPQDGKCICKDGYYDDNKGGCLECAKAIVDCFTCENENKCLSCKNQSNFSPYPVGGKCVCVEGWILDGEVCKLCGDEIIGCKTCESVSKCDACNEDLHFVQTPTPQGKCICMSKYWLDGTICSLCSNKIKGCDTCSDDGSKCFSCQDPNRSPNQDGSSCDCKEYFYEDTNQVCQLCDQKQSCLRCNQTDPAHKCFQCDSNKHWNATPSNGLCKCMTGYNQYDGKCILCTVPGCIQCHTQTTCTRCDPTKQFNPQADHDTCTCIAGTYKSQDKQSCLNCSSILGCKQCSNANDCTLCDDSKHFIQNAITNKCDCMKSYYLKNNQSCEQCNSTIPKCVECLTMGSQVQCTACEKGWGTSTSRKNCVNCSDLSVGCVDCSDGGHCLKCDGDKGFVLRDNVCFCKQGLYQKNGQCLECSQAIPGCIACNSKAQCTTCTNQNHFSPTPNPTTHKCQCLSGWTLTNNQCQSCTIITGCLQCSSNTTCTNCDTPHFFQPTPNKTCQCKPSYWLNSTQCQQCSTSIYNCKSCSQDGKQCQECLDPNRQVKKDGTLCECKKFMYQDSESRKCQLCDEYKNCLQCSSQGNHQCQLCDTQKFWNLTPTPTGQCTCQPTYTQFNHSCIECKVTGCSQCQQTNACYQCSKENNFNPQPTVDGKCECQPDTLIDDGKCYYCNQKIVGCMTCENFTQCEKCAQEEFFVLDNDTKKCKCDPSHYLAQTICKNCSQRIKYCQQCIITATTNQCTQCQKGFQPSQDHTTCLNCQDLIIGCADCIDMQHCQECDTEGHFVFTQDKTRCICDRGYFLLDRGCEECGKKIVGCEVCREDGQQCSQCDGEGHFELNNNTKKCQCINDYFLTNTSCVNCSTLIPNCSTCSPTGSQCLTCQSGYFLSQGKCSLCSSSIPGCTECSSDGLKCSKCNTDDKFVFNNKTERCDCVDKYFLNNTECSLCDKKFIGCSVCDVTQCHQCKPQHFIYNNDTKQCLCQPQYYLNLTSQTCTLCSQSITGCLLCTNPTQCFSCNDTQQFILDNTTNKCLCKSGYFLQQKLCSLCSSVYPGCTNCSQPNNTCSSCNTDNNFVYDQQSHLCMCKQLYYVASSTECRLCSNAITYCQSCLSGQKNFTPSCTKCKDGFELSQTKLSCTCPSGNDKQIIEGQCVDKQKINWLFYVAIGGGVLLVIVVGIVVWLKWKKAKSRVSLQQEQFDDDNTSGKRRKQETLLTSENTSNLLKSSGSLDIDE